jgi:glycosyltransferase involved in cell wall biosynthesis
MPKTGDLRHVYGVEGNTDQGNVPCGSAPAGSPTDRAQTARAAAAMRHRRGIPLMPIGQRPLRICLLSYRSNPHCGGQGVYIKHLSRELTQLGHRVDVVTGPPDPMLDGGVQVHRLPTLDLYDPKDPFRMPTLAELRRPVNLIEWLGVATAGFPEPFTFGLRLHPFFKRRLSRYDIVHDNQSLSYGLWLISRRIPTIATIHHPITIDRQVALRATPSAVEKIKQLRWFSFVGMQKRVARMLPGIITVSNAARDDLARAFAIPKARFEVIPNGIDTRVFRPLPGVPRSPCRVIVTSSAETPLKGLLYLLHAVAHVARCRPVKLIVVGTPKPDGEVMRLIRRLGIGRIVAFTGRIPESEFVRQYARAAVAVVPSVYEGFGLPAGEAMACGVPVVATTGGALPEVIGDAGHLVPPENAKALAAAIRKLLDHPDRAAALGRIGYDRVQQRFSWTHAAERTAAVYHRTIHDYRRH